MNFLILIIVTTIVASIPIPKEPQICLLVKDTNKYRISKGVGILKPDIRLDNAAKQQCDEIIESGIFSHNSVSTLKQRVEASGYDYTQAAENIYKEVGYPNKEISYTRALLGWISSASHEKNLANIKYTSVGHYFCSQENTNYWVQVFGAGDNDVTQEYTCTSLRCVI